MKKGKYLIIRGPLGVGKTTIARKLSKILNAKYISLDKVLEDNNLDVVDKKEGRIPAKNFIKADNLILGEIKHELKKGKIVIFDGCFYHKEQIKHLKRNLGKGFVFTLNAPLSVCISRDTKRKRIYGEDAAKVVYELVSKFNYGINLNTHKKTEKEVIREILKKLSI